jgi:MFS family permease
MTEAQHAGDTGNQPSKTPIRSALKTRDFTLLWSGQSLSSVGDQVFPLALAILVLHHGGGATGLGVILATMTVATVIGFIAAAALGDRWRRTRIMMSADALRALATVGIAIVGTRSGLIPLGAFVALMGFGRGIFQPVFGAAIPRLLPKDLLQPANALNSLSMYVAMVMGPGLAGAIIAPWGPTSAIWLDCGTFVISAVSLAAIREPAPEADTAPSASGISAALNKTRTDLREGFRALLDRPWLAATTGMATGIMLLVSAPSLVLLPVVATSRLGGVHAYSIILISSGVGSVIGSLISARVRPRRPGLLALTGALTIGISDLGLAFFHLPGVAATWWLSGVGNTLFNVLLVTAIQKDVPHTVMARVMALDWLGSMALMPLGYAFTGVAVHLVGARSVLVAGAIIVFVLVPLPLLAPGGAAFSRRIPQKEGRPAEASPDPAS